MAQFPLSNLLDGTKKLATKIYNATGELFTPTNPGVVQLSGSNMEYYGATIDARPDPTTVPVGASFTIVDTSETWLSNGTTWVVF